MTSPNPAHRIHITQTLGALIGGVVRVTVPELGTAERDDLLERTDRAIATLDRRDDAGQAEARLELAKRFLLLCPNPYLVSATEDAIESLMFHLRMTRAASSPKWSTLRSGYEALKRALEGGNAVDAELAVEEIFELARRADTVLAS